MFSFTIRGQDSQVTHMKHFVKSLGINISIAKHQSCLLLLLRCKYTRYIEKKIEQTRMESKRQQETLSQLVDRVNQQARLIGELQTQSIQGSTTRIPRESTCHPAVHREERLQTKTPALPVFSGDLPVPKGEVEFDNWIFQIKSLQKTFTDDAIRNAVVANARGITRTVVRAVGYDAELSLMISHLEDRFGLGDTSDALLLECHQMSQGVNEKVQDYGSKLECKCKSPINLACWFTLSTN